MEAREPLGRQERAALLGIALASLALKLGLSFWLRDLACVMDECDYERLARGLLAGEGLQASRGYVWPPGYPAFLAGCSVLGVEPLAGARMIQPLLSTASLPFVAWIAARTWGSRAALPATALCAFEPNLVAFSHLGWPATLFLLPFLAGLALLLDRPRPDRARAAAAGALLGLAALVKAIALWFAPVAALWLLVWGGREDTPLWRSERPWQRLRARAPLAALVVVATFATIAPWTIRNVLTYDHFVWLDTTLGRNLSLGHDVPPPAAFDYPWLRHPRYQPGRRAECTETNPVLRERCERRRALAFVAAHPGLGLARVPDKLADLYTPNSFPLRHVRLGWYGNAPHREAVPGWAALFALPWLVAALGATAALCLRAGPAALLLGLWLAYHAGVHAATIGTSRFRMVIAPIAVILATPLLTGGLRRWARWTAEASIRQRAAWGAAWLGLAWLWAQRWMEAFGPAAR